MKVKRVKSLLAAAVAAAGLVAFAEPVVEITKAWQANPGSGVVDFTYEVRNLEGAGAWAYDMIVRVEAKGCDKTYTFTNENVSAGSTTTNVDYKTKLGKVSPNVSIYATLGKRPGGVQLWAGGPYFAECNVGAEKAEEPGYYFWWGDTVGYKRNGSSWDAVNGSTTGFSFASGNCPTYNTSIEELYNNGYIDANSADGKLKPEHDAARAYFGGDWRMPTKADLDALVTNCATEWTANWEGTGKAGRIFKGTGAYASKRIFFPAAGAGDGSDITNLGTYGSYWSSTPTSSLKNAWRIYFNSGDFNPGNIDSFDRYYGRTVRPVRDAE